MPTLDPALILREYNHELTSGERGAYSRVAKKLGCSDQHVSNVIKRETKPLDALVPAPVPGAEDYDRIRHAANETLRRQQNAALLASLLANDVPTNANTANDANSPFQSCVGYSFAVPVEYQCQQIEFAGWPMRRTSAWCISLDHRDYDTQVIGLAIIVALVGLWAAVGLAVAPKGLGLALILFTGDALLWAVLCRIGASWLDSVVPAWRRATVVLVTVALCGGVGLWLSRL